MTTLIERGPTPTATITMRETATREDSPLARFFDYGRLALDEDQRAGAREMILAYIKEVVARDVTAADDPEAAINERIALIDQTVERGLNAILHDPHFQKLEGSWRGLAYLVQQAETGPDLKLKVLNVTKEELRKDADRAPSPDQTVLYKKVYDEELGVYGGSPVGVIVGDFEFSRSSADVGLLDSIAKVAASAHAPFIAAANPGMFNWKDFTEVPTTRDLRKLFEGADYTKWRSFRESEDSRYVGLCMPHVLMRPPYDPEEHPAQGIHYKEEVNGTVHSSYLWGNAAYAFAARLTDAFARHHWCAAIRGAEGGGLVTGLPTHTFATDEGDIALKCPTEIAITDPRARELSDLGFIPLTHCKNTDYAAFFFAQSSQAVRRYDSVAATENAKLSTQLPYIFATSRIAHYLKAIMRDKIGAFTSRDECERALNEWIMRYVTPLDNAQREVKAQFPFREARIEVVDVPGKPGTYKAVAFLRPHFQLDELTISLRLVAQLPPSAQR